jgi:hypothetical protein
MKYAVFFYFNESECLFFKKNKNKIKKKEQKKNIKNAPKSH